MKTFDNVAKLKLATLTTGQFVETGGYYTKGGGGAAKYLIVAPQAADGYSDHVLANGNVAVLQEGFAQSYMSQWGVVNGVSANNQPAAQAALNGGNKVVNVDLESPDFGNAGLVVPSAVTMQGLGMFKTKMNWQATGATLAIALGGSSGSTNSANLRDLSITNAGGDAINTRGIELLDNTRSGVNVYNVSVGDFSQLHFGLGWRQGINCYNFTANKLIVFGNKTSIDISYGSNLASYRDCWFKSDGSAGTKLGFIRGSTTTADQTFGLEFFSCGFEAHDSGLNIGSATTNDKAAAISFFGGYWEGNNDYHIQAKNTQGLNVVGGYWQMNNNMPVGIECSEGTTATISGVAANNIPSGGFFLKSISTNNKISATSILDMQGTSREVDSSGTFDFLQLRDDVTIAGMLTAMQIGVGNLSMANATIGRTGLGEVTFNVDGNVDMDTISNRRWRFNQILANPGIPTSSSGLVSGDFWSDSGTVKVIP